jgi:hypothetical protein
MANRARMPVPSQSDSLPADNGLVIPNSADDRFPDSSELPDSTHFGRSRIAKLVIH